MNTVGNMVLLPALRAKHALIYKKKNQIIMILVQHQMLFSAWYFFFLEQISCSFSMHVIIYDLSSCVLMKHTTV